MIVPISLLTGLATAVLLVAGPFSGSTESSVTGAILVGFAIGWAMLAAWSARAARTSTAQRSQRWAVVPAGAMALTGAALVVVTPGESALSALGWVWPPALLALVVWMAVQARRQGMGRGQRALLWPVFAVLGLAAVGGAYETIGHATDSPVAAVPGDRLINVGGHRLNIRCVGSGSPTVVLEPGLGESATAMAQWIAPDVARTTTVCSYDRAGHGRSDAASAGQADAARDLHTLLGLANVPGPYLVAGHSLGGMFALSYAHRYPDEVGGVVLVDSMHPRQHNAFAKASPVLAVVPTLARVGLARLLVDPTEGEPTDQAKQLADDIAEMPKQLGRAAELKSLGDRPLFVATAGTGSADGWTGEQDELATLSTRSTHRTIADATHDSLTGDERDAAESSRAIRDAVLAVRADQGQGA